MKTKQTAFLNLILGLCVLGLLISACSNTKKMSETIEEKITPQSPQAPVAAIKPHTTNVHGEVLEDNYYWLRERESEAVLDYLKAENAYTDKMTAQSEGLRSKLYDEILGRIKEDDLSVPEKDGPYEYYSRTETGKSYSIHCRKKVGGGEEEVVLDENKLAEGLEYFRLSSFDISPDHNLLLYSTDTNGSEKNDVYVKNLTTGNIVEKGITEIAGSLFWVDNTTYYYSRHDDAMRPHKLFKHTFGARAGDVLVYQEDDDRFFLGAGILKSKDYIVMYMGSKITTEIRVLDTSKSDAKFQVLCERKQGVEYDVTKQGDYFYILSNENALNFKLMRCHKDNLAKENWEEIIAHDPTVMLSGLEAFKDYLVIYGRKNGMKSISVMDAKSGEVNEVEFPEKVYTYWGSENPEYDSETIRFTYSSLISPRTVYDYNLRTKTLDAKKEYEVVGGYDKSQYVTERLEATAPDGTKIPMSIAYKKGLEKNGANPTFLYSYGSYGSSTDPYFSTARLSLLDRGFVFAMAHIRGGGEMGRVWYEDGKFLKKKNTFTDFIACGEHLIAQQYTSKEHIAINGGSAGGLLMGAVTNMRPDLFKVVVADVPFVDVVNTMLDESIPLTVIEYEEWGNPNDKVYYDYMKSYSPYDNVERKDYPHLLITAGLNDPRVQYWEPAKWCAKLRTMKTDQNDLLLKTNMGAGHGGKSGRYGWIEDLAFEYAFIFDKLGIKE